MPAPFNPVALAIDKCHDICDNFLHFEELIDAFNRLVDAIYAWGTSSVFPNVIYTEDNAVFNYVPHGLNASSLIPIPNMPNVLLTDNLLNFTSGTTLNLVLGKQIANNIYYDNTIDEFFFRRVKADGSTEKAFPFVGCVRYDLNNAKLLAYTGTEWKDISLNLDNRAVIYNISLNKFFVTEGNTSKEIPTPYRSGDLRENGGKLERFNGTAWLEYWPNGFARVKTDLSDFEYMDNGTWKSLA
jgi:hypothetical protein